MKRLLLVIAAISFASCFQAVEEKFGDGGFSVGSDGGKGTGGGFAGGAGGGGGTKPPVGGGTGGGGGSTSCVVSRAGCCAGTFCLDLQIQSSFACGLKGESCKSCGSGQICGDGICEFDAPVVADGGVGAPCSSDTQYVV